MKYSYFSSIKSRRCRQVSVAELVELIGQEGLRAKCDAIAAAVAEGDGGEADALKAELPVIVLNELYAQGAPRLQGSGDPTGLVMIDYDNCQDEEALQALQADVVRLAVSHPELKDLIVAAHVSPRRHGVHVWYRWIAGCRTIRECHARFAEWSGLQGYDEGCNDRSRCSYLVDGSRFFVQNWDAMDRNEEYAQRQRESMAMAEPAPRAEVQPQEADGREWPAEYAGVPYDLIVQGLTRVCAPKSKLAADGSVMEGARDNTFFKVACYLRYLTDCEPQWVASLAPAWARALDEGKPGRVMELCRNACRKSPSFALPKTLKAVLAELGASVGVADAGGGQEGPTESEARAELARIDEGQRFLLSVPKALPPIFKEYCDAFPPDWKPAAVLALLPLLGTIVSRARARYLDGRLHSPSFQMVVEAKFGRGKSNITDMARVILRPLEECDAVGNAQLNAYNVLVEQANSAKTLPAKPDVLVRKIVGDFTVAGFEEVLGTSKGLHIWCGTSEIDEVKRIWPMVSYIARKAFDNDLYGRSLQTVRTFRGERPVFWNTLLCGTPRAVARCYPDPEDGLVSRTVFFKHQVDDGQMPSVKMAQRTRDRIGREVARLHALYCCDESGVPVPEQEIALEWVNRDLNQWLQEQYDLSVRTGNESRDSFRRRDAVIGFRAALVAMAVYRGLGLKVGAQERKIVKGFARWVAGYSLEMHVMKFGRELNKIAADDDADVCAAPYAEVLPQLPDSFTIREAYRVFGAMSPGTVRTMLSRLVGRGLLDLVERGVYTKKK